mgnify:CR=1 FL=1
MTLRSTAIYHAKAAFSLMGMTGRQDSNLSRLTTGESARWRFDYTAPNGAAFVVILRHAADYRERGGAVDATATKAANMAAPAPVEAAPAPVEAVKTVSAPAFRLVTLSDLRAAFNLEAARCMAAVESADWMDSSVDDSSLWGAF